MKTAISLDGSLLREADETARSMGLSRSRLFSLALQDYLRQLRQAQMIEQLNRVYSEQPIPTEARLTKRIKAKVRPTIKDQW